MATASFAHFRTGLSDAHGLISQQECGGDRFVA